MALIQRLFNSRERRGRSWGFRCGRNERNFETPEALGSYKTWDAPEFEANQIHLLIFRERDGKKLLFDSRAIKKKDEVEKQAPKSTASFSGPFCRLKASSTSTIPRNASEESLASAAEQNGSPGPGGGNSNYTFLRPSSDVKLLGEMMFGSVAMIYRGPLLKVHTIKVPPQLLLSQVFVLKPPKESIDQDSIDKDSLSSSDLGLRRSISMTSIGDMDKEPVAHSMPVAVPQSPYRSRDDNSPVASASSNSFLTPFPSPLSNGSTTPSSFHKRWLRNQVTSMENGVMRRRSSDVMEEPISTRVRNPKISIGIVISLFEEGDVDKMQKFQSFFFSHFNLIEGHFYKLSCAIEKALTFQKRNYIHPIMQALHEFRMSVHALYTAPRIKKPIWLNMMTFPLDRNHLCEHLMRELMTVLDSFNNRQTNFFISRLLTGVLTHHLAWVPTVMPAGATPSRAYLDKHSSTTLDWLAKSHPYNPLWAQLGDMYGAVGYPNKVAKTIIVGKKADLVCRLLYILTYFIRCGEVHECQEKREQVVMEYKEVALNCGYDFIQATESGYHSDPAQTDNEEHFSSLDPTHHLESSLETVEETPESLASPVQSLTSSVQASLCVLDGRKLTLAYFKGKSDTVLDGNIESQTTPEDGETTPVGVAPELPIKCKDDDHTMEVAHEFVAPVGNVTSDQQQMGYNGKLTGGLLEEKYDVNLQEQTGNSPTNIVVKCKCDPKLGRKCKSEIPVGKASSNDLDSEQPLIKCKDPLDTVLKQTCESVALVGHANVIQCKDDTMLEAKKESVAHLGRSVETTEQASCMTVKTDGNENKLTNTEINHVNIDGAKSLIDSRYHICEGQTDSKLSKPQGLKLASKQCNFTQDVNCNNPQTGGRKSPEMKVAHDLYYQSDTKTETSILNQAEKAAYQRSLSSSSSTSSVFSSDMDSGLWMGVNKGSEVIADTRPSAEQYTRAISTHSTTSTHSYDTDGTLTPDHEELPLAFSELLSEIQTKSNYLDNFGRSLLGGLSQKYVPGMALHGVAELDVQDVMSDLELSVQHSVLDEAIAEAVCVVANTDKWTVELLSSERPAPSAEKPLAQEIASSDSVSELLDSVQLLWNMRMPPDYCLMHLEDCLQQLYFKSTLMAAYLDKNPTSCHKDLSMSLGVETSDIPLLLGITSVHAPQVIMNILKETFEKETLATP